MNELKQMLENVFINFSGNYSIYANDFQGNIIELNSKQKINAASCIKKKYILISLLQYCDIKHYNAYESVIKVQYLSKKCDTMIMLFHLDFC